MKVKNIKFAGFAHDKNGKMIGSKLFCSEKAMSNWANKWFNIYEESTVEIYDFNTENLIAKYHA